jgi:hypothetical protein
VTRVYRTGTICCLVTVFTSPVDSTGIPDVRFEETGGGELDSDGGLGTFPFHLFKVGSPMGPTSFDVS